MNNPNGSDLGCGCGPKNIKKMDFRAVPSAGEIKINGKIFPVVSCKWSFGDQIGRIMVRTGMNRMNYAVKPGIYAVGDPDSKSNVFVSANYKLSFDILRRDLAAIDAWIFVIDTKGVNVWCSAGKGTFGTQEIIKSVRETGLEDIVSHKTLILPQLSAPGVSAHLVKRDSKFSVIYGPVRSENIREFVQNGFKASEEMRQVRFNLFDRLAVSMLEAVLAAKIGLIVTLSAIAAAFVYKTVFHSSVLFSTAKILIEAFWLGIFSGSIISTALLPYIPFRSFSAKGAATGALLALLVAVFGGIKPAYFNIISFILISASVSAYVALNFTGSSTYTSLSGVKKELKYSLPVIITCASAGLLVWLADFCIKAAI